jgi:ABC-type antimicrobial peptide transport system permease subunit
VRTRTNPRNVVSALQGTIRSVNRSAAVSGVTTMEEVISNTIWAPRLNLMLIGLFAVLALLLGAVGIYGVMAYAVTQRTHEIGIRMALGARRYDVVKLVLSQGIRLVITGAILGLAAALGLTRLMSTLLYGVSATDPMTFSGVVVILAGVALMACYIPARRAAKVDPMVALRYE